MPFIVPELQPHLGPRDGFGACKLTQDVLDPGGAHSTGLVVLRGFVSPDPMYHLPTPPPPHGMVPLFTMPVGMRPIADRRFMCISASYLSGYDAKTILCVFRPSGLVEAQLAQLNGTAPSLDGGIFFDGVCYPAEK